MLAKYSFVEIAVLVVLTSAVANDLHAQQIVLHNDTAFLNERPYLICKKGDDQKRFEIMALHGQQLIDIHNSRVQIDGKIAYVVTFLNDRKQAMIVGNEQFPISFLDEIVKCGLIHNDEIDVTAETAYANNHPLPDGYIDVDQIANY